MKNRIKELRAQKNMTQKDLALILNCAPTAVSKYELEQLGIDSEKINVLCDIFGCTADYLLCRSDNPKPAVSEADADLLYAYHHANKEIRGIVDHTLAPYRKEDTASSTA